MVFNFISNLFKWQLRGRLPPRSHSYVQKDNMKLNTKEDE